MKQTRLHLRRASTKRTKEMMDSHFKMMMLLSPIIRKKIDFLTTQLNQTDSWMMMKMNLYLSSLHKKKTSLRKRLRSPSRRLSTLGTTLRSSRAASSVAHSQFRRF